MVFGHRIIWLWVCLVFADCTIAGQTIYETYSAHHHIKVDDIKGHRFLRFDGSMETRMNVRHPLLGQFEYTEFFQIPLLWTPKPKNVLMIGLGGGSTQRAYQAYYPDVHVDTVELDSAVIGVAKLYFGVNATRSHKIYKGDGRLFLRRNKQKNMTRSSSTHTHRTVTAHTFPIILPRGNSSSWPPRTSPPMGFSPTT